MRARPFVRVRSLRKTVMGGLGIVGSEQQLPKEAKVVAAIIFGRAPSSPSAGWQDSERLGRARRRERAGGGAGGGDPRSAEVWREIEAGRSGGLGRLFSSPGVGPRA